MEESSKVRQIINKIKLRFIRRKNSVLDAANLLYSLENEAASFGLKINTVKTKSMSIVNSSTTRQARPIAIVLNGHAVKVVNQFTYLGCEICKDGGSDPDVD